MIEKELEGNGKAFTFRQRLKNNIKRGRLSSVIGLSGYSSKRSKHQVSSGKSFDFMSHKTSIDPGSYIVGNRT